MFVRSVDSRAIKIIALNDASLSNWLASQSPFVRNWLEVNRFNAKPEQVCLVPTESGALQYVLVGVVESNALWSLASLPAQLPNGQYILEGGINLELAALGWGLAYYQFSRYKTSSRKHFPLLYVPESIADRVTEWVRASFLVRDLINTPAEDLPPKELCLAAQHLAHEFNADIEIISGHALLDKNYPAIHAVGRASTHEPCLIDLRWGDKNHPKVTLVGKGVCFDSGGMDIKPSSGMLIMKKDMGGAAHVLGLARLIMAFKLPISLRVLIPAVENMIGGNAFKPGDVIKTRKGLSIEIGNTDAEGRVVLADALAEAASEQPELIIDYATLTGAARVALGGELPALYGTDDSIVASIMDHCKEVQDPLWPMPLYAPYQKLNDSKIADINNSPSSSLGGSIAAALFLKTFVGDSSPWLHMDLSAWNYSSRPGRPEGGEAMGLRAIYRYLELRFLK